MSNDADDLLLGRVLRRFLQKDEAGHYAEIEHHDLTLDGYLIIDDESERLAINRALGNEVLGDEGRDT